MTTEAPSENAVAVGIDVVARGRNELVYAVKSADGTVAVVGSRRSGKTLRWLDLVLRFPLEWPTGRYALLVARRLPHGRVRHVWVKRARDRIRAERRLYEGVSR